MPRAKKVSCEMKLLRNRERKRKQRRKENDLKKKTTANPVSPPSVTITELLREDSGTVSIKNEPLDCGEDEHADQDQDAIGIFSGQQPPSASPSAPQKILTIKLKQNACSAQVKTEVNSRTSPKMTIQDRENMQRRRKRLLARLPEDERTKYLEEEQELGPGPVPDEYRILRLAALRTRVAELELGKLKAEMTPEDLEAFEVSKELQEIPKGDLELEWEIKLLRKWRSIQKAKSKRLSDLSPEKREEARAKRRKWNGNRKKKHLKIDRAPDGQKAQRREKSQKLKLDPEKGERLKRERYQRMVMRKIERKAQMTEEEMELQRQKRYMQDLTRKSKLTEEKLLDRRKRSKIYCKNFYERKKIEGTYEKFLEKERRRKEQETGEKRELRLQKMRISAAKKSLRRKLEAKGVPQEEIEKQLEELAKNYRNVRALRNFKSRKDKKPDITTAEDDDDHDGVSVEAEMTSPSSASMAPHEHWGSLQQYQPIQMPSRIPPDSIDFDDASNSNCDDNFDDYDNDNGVIEDVGDPATLTSAPHSTHENASQHNYSHKSFDLIQSPELSPADIPSVSKYPSCDFIDNSSSFTPEAPATTSSASSVSSSASWNIQINDHGSGPSKLKVDACRASLVSPVFPVPFQNPSMTSLCPSVSSFPSEQGKAKRVGRPLGKPTNKFNIGRDCVCDICGNAYTKEDLLKHVRHVHHPYYQNGHCTVCSERFKSAQFQVHFRTVHIPNGDIDLTKIDERFLPKAPLKSIPEKDKKRFPCDQCGQVLSRPALFYHTKRFHNPLYDPTTKKCTLCGEELHGKFFYKHFNTRHPEYVPENGKPECEKQHICDICGSRYASSTALRLHISSVHHRSREAGIYKCRDCPEEKVFKSKEWLSLHYKAVHPDKLIAPEIESSAKFQCNFCPEEFSKKSEKYKHIREKHQDRCFPCLYCNSVRRTEIGILTHYGLDCHHIPQEEKTRWVREKWDRQIDKMLVKCEICRTELQLVTLKRHYKERHEIREGEHKCWECEDKSFMARVYLGVHLLEVHGLQPDQWLDRISKLNVRNAEVKAVNQKDQAPGRKRRVAKIARGIRQKKSEDEREMRKKKLGDMRKMKSESRRKKVAVKVEEDGELEILKAEDGESDEPVSVSARKRKSRRGAGASRPRPRYKECEDSEDEMRDADIEVKPEVKKSYLSFVNDEKLNVMRSSVSLKKVNVQTLSSTLGVNIEDRSDLKYIFV